MPEEPPEAPTTSTVQITACPQPTPAAEATLVQERPQFGATTRYRSAQALRRRRHSQWHARPHSSQPQSHQPLSQRPQSQRSQSQRPSRPRLRQSATRAATAAAATSQEHSKLQEQPKPQQHRWRQRQCHFVEEAGSHARSSSRSPQAGTPNAAVNMTAFADDRVAAGVHACSFSRSPHAVAPGAAANMSAIAVDQVVVLNCEDIGRTAAQCPAFSRNARGFAWDAVKGAIGHYEERNRCVQAVCCRKTVQRQPPPPELAGKLVLAPVIDECEDPGRLFVVQLAQTYQCPFVDNWSRVTSSKTSFTSWLRKDGSRQKIEYIFDSLGMFVPLRSV